MHSSGKQAQATVQDALASPQLAGENSSPILLSTHPPLLARFKSWFHVLPKRAVWLVSALLLVNVAIWVVVAVLTHYFNAALTTTAPLVYSFGLRHALDADHIACIDLVTRRLIASNQRPTTVGTFFSLGHSTVVFITSVVVAATAAGISRRFDNFSYVGGIVGSSVSSAFLLLLGAANAWILVILARKLRRHLHPELTPDPASHANPDLHLAGGPLFRLFKTLFRLVDRPWKVYPIGLLFGLGFDTSSQVALLGIAAVQATEGTSFWLILLFPVLFTSAMCLIDTLDGIMMLLLYTSGHTGPSTNSAPDTSHSADKTPRNTISAPAGAPDAPTALSHSSTATSSPPPAADPLTLLYTNLLLTSLTVIIALVIGVLNLLGLAEGVLNSPPGAFWDGVRSAQNHFDVIGGAICGLFVLVGVFGALSLKRWRAWVEARRARRLAGLEVEMAVGVQLT